MRDNAALVRWALNHLSTLGILGVTVLVTLIVGLIAEAAADRTLARKAIDQRSSVNEMLRTAIGFIGISSAIITGIVLGNQRDVLVSATTGVANEASVIRGAGILASDLPGPGGRQVPPALAAYARAEAGAGFRGLRNGSASPVADGAYRELGQAILGLRPGGDQNAVTLKASLFGDWTRVGELRSDRFQLANRELAPELWILFVGTGLLTVIMVAGLTAEGRADRLATLGAALTVGLIFFAAVTLSYPFSGSIAVSPAPLLQTAAAPA